MEAIFGLLEDGVGVLLECFFADFFATIGGEAVEDEVAFGGVREEVAIDLIGLEEGFFFGLAFLPHGEPDVGIDDVRSRNCCLHIGRGGDVGCVELFEKFGRR